jgi:uncharacterized repeat protein (TIGR01451 family)
LLTAAVLLLALAGTAQAAEGGPVFDIKTRWADTNLRPGGEGEITIEARNIGDAPAAAEALTITDYLPAGVKVKDITWGDAGEFSGFCSGGGTEIATCAIPPQYQSVVPTIAPSPGASSGGVAPQPSGFLPRIYMGITVDSGAAGLGTNTATIIGGGAQPATAMDSIPLTLLPTEFEVIPDSYSADLFGGPYPSGTVSRKAGDHPFEQRLSFDLTAKREVVDGAQETVAAGRLKTIVAQLPQGFSGNPQAVPKCDPARFAEAGAVMNSTRCPAASQVGYINLAAREPGSSHGMSRITKSLSRIPMYNLKPPKGVLADFGFTIAGVAQQHMYLQFDPTRNYAIDAVTPYVPGLASILGAEVTIWGVPGDANHDRFRYFPEAVEHKALGARFGQLPIRPLITNPTDCGIDNGGTLLRVESYEHPGRITSPVEGAHLNVDGCDDPRLRFNPALALRPVAHRAAAPSGLDLEVAVPQRDEEVANASDLYAANGAPEGVGSPPARSVVIQLPEGVSVSPAAAQGLDPCSASQIGLVTASPPRFNDASPQCPESSRVGTVNLTTPITPNRLEGSIYVASQKDNPFDSPIALYLAIEDPDTGLTVKIPARVALDAGTGRITVTLDDLPQQPFSELAVHLKDGPRGVLRMPSTCGTYTARYAFTSWPDPQPVEGVSSFVVDQGCGERSFQPRLEGGSIDALAGSPSPLLLEIQRESGEDGLAGFGATLPPGLVANFGSVPRCSDAAAAEARCPEAARVGSVQLAIGEGTAPLWLPRPGHGDGGVYLAGPYRGAPLSFVFVLAGKAGPLDLGTVALRAPVAVNPFTAQARVHLAQLPQILGGVPIDYRTIRILLDRPGFVRAPTDCTPMRLAGEATSVSAAAAGLSTRFQVGRCGSLRFAPRFALQVRGGLARNSHPGLRVLLRGRPGEAGIDTATFGLPRNEILDLRHVRALCARRLPPALCPGASRLGQARFRSPLLDGALRGPVFLREPKRGLPDLIVDLRREELHLVLRGQIEDTAAGLRVRLSDLPDVPISSAQISLAGGSRGILVNSEGLCALPKSVWTGFRAQSGRRLSRRAPVRIRGSC